VAAVPALDALRRVVRARVDLAEREAHARDLWPRTTLAMARGQRAEAPVAVAFPRDAVGVAEVLHWAEGAGVAVIPWGAGSGVCGAAAGRQDAIALDLKLLRRIGPIDAERGTVRVDAGVLGQHLEDHLEAQGWCTRHSPSSIACSTVGGWAASRSAGQFSSRYGTFPDMVRAVEATTPSGRLAPGMRIDGWPTLPWLLGSEGALGVITSLDVTVVPVPATREIRAYQFSSVDAALGAIRATMQSGLLPAVVRLYDPVDTLVGGKATTEPEKKASTWLGSLGRAVASAPGLKNHLLSLPLSLPRLVSGLADTLAGDCVLLLGFEGERDACVEWMKAAHAIATAAGGGSLGADPGEHWYAHRHDVSYKMAPIFAGGGFADTMEVAATWGSVPELYARVRAAAGRHGLCMAHFSHAYREGCSIYFTFAATGSLDVYDTLWADVLGAAEAVGATVAHHHGAGQLKAEFAARELAGLAPIFHRLKSVLDPRGVLNPGRMFPPGDRQGRPYPPLGIDEVAMVATLDAQEDAGSRDRFLAARGWRLRHPTAGPLAFSIGLERAPWDSRVLGVLADAEAPGRPPWRISLPPVPRSAAGPDLRAHLPPAWVKAVTVPVERAA
jgi:alkyldihydroxyacetonephosphate synthase